MPPPPDALPPQGRPAPVALLGVYPLLRPDAVMSRQGPGVTHREATLDPLLLDTRPIGMVVMTLEASTEFGRLATRRGVIYGGHHGRPTMLDSDINDIMATLTVELRSSIRAMKHRLQRAREEGHV